MDVIDLPAFDINYFDGCVRSTARNVHPWWNEKTEIHIDLQSIYCTVRSENVWENRLLYSWWDSVISVQWKQSSSEQCDLSPVWKWHKSFSKAFTFQSSCQHSIKLTAFCWYLLEIKIVTPVCTYRGTHLLGWQTIKSLSAAIFT